MEIVIILIAIPYLVLMALGFKSTWKFAVNSALAGNSGIVLPLLLFVLVILVVGPIMGIINIIKLLIVLHDSSKTN